MRGGERGEMVRRTGGRGWGVVWERGRRGRREGNDEEGDKVMGREKEGPEQGGE